MQGIKTKADYQELEENHTILDDSIDAASIKLKRFKTLLDDVLIYADCDDDDKVIYDNIDDEKDYDQFMQKHLHSVEVALTTCVDHVQKLRKLLKD